MNSRPGYCAGSAFGVPDFGAVYPAIEQIRERAASRRGKAQPRSVDLVFKLAKEKGSIRTAVHKTIHETTGIRFRSALHWALRIGTLYFELYRLPDRSTVEFVKRTWDPERVRLITDEKKNYGTTYMTDEEIEAIGRHYIRCWSLDYSAIHNNRQILLIQVCKDCLEEPDAELGRAWIGYKALSPVAKAMKPITHGAMKLLGCPKPVRDDWDDAFTDLYLTYLALIYSDKWGSYSQMKEEFSQTSAPWRTLVDAWLGRMLYNTHIVHAIPSLLPFPTGVLSGGNEPHVTNLRTESQKWTNRAMIPLIPAGAALGTVLFARDALVMTVAHTRTIVNAFSRRSEAKFEDRLAAIEAIGDPKHPFNLSVHNGSKISFETKCETCVEALNKFWNGSGTWDEIIPVWKGMMESEEITWDDIAKEVRERRHANQSAFDGKPRPAGTSKEKKIRMLIDLTLYAMYVLVIFAGIEGLVVLLSMLAV